MRSNPQSLCPSYKINLFFQIAVERKNRHLITDVQVSPSNVFFFFYCFLLLFFFFFLLVQRGDVVECLERLGYGAEREFEAGLRHATTGKFSQSTQQ